MNKLSISVLLVLFSLIVFSNCGNNKKSEESPSEKTTVEQYECPMKCTEEIFEKPGKCSVCEMDLIPITKG